MSSRHTFPALRCTQNPLNQATALRTDAGRKTLQLGELQNMVERLQARLSSFNTQHQEM